MPALTAEIYGFDGYIDIQNSNNLQLVFFIIQIVLLISPGFKGNKWTENNLIKKGYVFSYAIKASNIKHAFELINNEETNKVNIRNRNKLGTKKIPQKLVIT